LPLTHHHLHSRFDNWSESVNQRQRNPEFFNRIGQVLPSRPLGPVSAAEGESAERA
jgi:hypothetical protein